MPFEGILTDAHLCAQQNKKPTKFKRSNVKNGKLSHRLFGFPVVIENRGGTKIVESCED